MYGKKQRIISFLMAFLLIFTFAFINPLTVQKSDAFAFAIPAMTPVMGRIITGVLVSAGYIIHEGAIASSDYDVALMDMSEVIYQTLDNAQKILLGTLSIIDNVVEVPTALYNSIVSGAEKVIMPDKIESLSEQGIIAKYVNFEPSSVNYPDITLPIYSKDYFPEAGTYTERKIDLREAQPFFVYEGTGSNNNVWELEGVKYFFNDFANDELPVATFETTDDLIFLTPDLSPYGIENYTSSSFPPVSYEYLKNASSTFEFSWTAKQDSTFRTSKFIVLDKSNITNINDLIIYTYFGRINTYSSDSARYRTVTDIYDKDSGEFLLQVINNVGGYFFTNVLNGKLKDVPFTYDLDLVPDTTIVPTIPNADSSANVLTLPTELSDTIGLTSSDVNVPTTDVPGSGTETIDRIDTNVGELVTGGTLGEQVNTNIGTVEGLHNELTQSADFTGLMDVLAEYISFMDISAISWLTTAIPLVVAPFIPFVSLGMILFFIDRVLNGGA